MEISLRTLANKNSLKDNERKSESNVHYHTTYQSRRQILEELEGIGINTDAFSSLPMERLQELLTNLQNMIKANPEGRKPGRPRSTDIQLQSLSETDKKILRHLLSSNGYVSSLTLAKQLDIPLSTVQRRRKRLESNFIERNYSLKVERFGWRIATLFISTANGSTSVAGKEILEMADTIISVTRTLGENTMDLKVDLIFRTNQQLLSLIDRIKSHEGVRNVFWSESVESIGKSNKCYQEIIDSY